MGVGCIRSLTTVPVVVVIAIAGVLGVAMGSGVAQAIPEYGPQSNLVTTLRCPVGDPWGGGPIGVRVDVYNQIRFPADGLPGPAIALIGWSTRSPQISGWTEYSIETRVSWRNLRSGATGNVVVPTRSRTVRWQVDLHPGVGPVAFTIRQKVGAIAFIPMVNPQTSTCRSSATA